MQQIYFIRHSLKDRTLNIQDAPLSIEGQQLAYQLPVFFTDIAVDAIYSSPYARSIDTIKPIAEAKALPIIIKESLSERKSGEAKDSVSNLAQLQWRDFDFKLTNGESLNDVKDRLLQALEDCLKQEAQVMIIGGHSTAFAVLFHALTAGEFGYQDYKSMPSPGVYLGSFVDNQLIELAPVPLPN